MAAKILSDLSKPDGLRIVEPDELVDFVAPLPVERLWGVGRVTLERMHQAGITTVGDLARADVPRLHAMFGAMRPHLYELPQRRDPPPVVGDYERQSYGEQSTFRPHLP